MDTLPPFDPKSSCVKCGYVIPDPVAPTKAGPDGALMDVGPAPAPQAPTVTYCNGTDCPWNLDHDEVWDEHLHQMCDTCGFEWLSLPLDAGQ